VSSAKKCLDGADGDDDQRHRIDDDNRVLRDEMQPFLHRPIRPSLRIAGRGVRRPQPFQLAADIIETSIAPSWQEVGQLGAITVIRTFLNFFLERDLAELDDHADIAPDKFRCSSPDQRKNSAVWAEKFRCSAA
jgi:hypothetical protein